MPLAATATLPNIIHDSQISLLQNIELREFEDTSDLEGKPCSRDLLRYRRIGTRCQRLCESLEHRANGKACGRGAWRHGPRVTARLPEIFAESGPNFRTLLPILISIGNVPAFVYVKERFGSGAAEQKYMTFVMRCRGWGVVDIAYNLWSNLQDSDPQRQQSLNQLAGTVTDIGHGVPGTLRLKPYGSKESFDLPIAWAETYDWQGLYVRLAGPARADHPFFRNFRGTSNLSAQLIVGGQLMPLRSGVALDSVRSDIAPLLEYCRSGKPNPMGNFEPVAGGTAAARVAAAADIDLGFLNSLRAPTYERIYRGQRPDTDADLQQRMLTPLAFHAAYWQACGATPDQSFDYHQTTGIDGNRLIGIPPDDFASYVVAASVYQPISRHIYDDTVTKDFSFDRVMAIYAEDFPDQILDWQAIECLPYGLYLDVPDRCETVANVPLVNIRDRHHAQLGKHVDFERAQPALGRTVTVARCRNLLCMVHLCSQRQVARMLVRFVWPGMSHRHESARCWEPALGSAALFSAIPTPL